MSESVTPPAAPEAAVPAPAPAATADTLKTDLPRLPVTDLDSLLGVPDEPTSVVADTPAEPAPTPEPVAAVPPEAPPAPETPPAIPEAPPPEGQDFPRNFRVHVSDGKEAAVLTLMHTGMSLREATEKVYGTTPPAAPAKTDERGAPQPPPPPPEDTAKPFDTQITAAQTELTALEAQQKTAEENQDIHESNRLTREIGKKERQIENLQRDRDQAVRQATVAAQTAQEDQFRQRSRQAAARAIQEFPILGVKPDGSKTPERVALEDFIASKREDPDYEAIFMSPRYPLILAREYAQEKGLKQAAGAPPPPTSAPARTAPRAPAAEVITPGRPSSATFQPTREQLLKDAGKMSAKQLDGLLGAQKA